MKDHRRAPSARLVSLRRARALSPWGFVLACALVQSACGGGGDDAGDDPEAAQLLAGLDEPVILSEAELDAMFPLVEPIDAVEDEDADDDPAFDASQGDQLEARLAAYVPTADASRYFTLQAHPNVPGTFVEATRRGVLFGMDNFDRLFPGFSVYGAAADRPFDVVFFDTPKPGTGFRPSITSCPNTTTWADCRPRLNVPYDNGAAIAAATLVHEVGHLAHVYYTLSPTFTDAGGLVMGSFRHSEFRWQREGSAQLIAARSPSWSAYDRLGSTRCAFEALQRGVTAWKDFSPVGAERYLPYQMSLLVDQVAWHRFGGKLGWILDWWIARPDARDPSRPESAARALLRTISPSGTSVDVAATNKMMVAAGFDLYARGRNPWTTKTLTADCLDVVGTALGAGTPGSATLTVPAVAFDAARIPIPTGALGDDVKALKLTLVADRPENARATLLAVQRDPWLACIAALDGAARATPTPRKACNDQHALLLGHLTPANAYTLMKSVDAPLRARLDGADIVAVVYHHLTQGSPLTPISAVVTVAIPTAEPLTITVRNSSSVEHVRFHLQGDSPFSGTRVDAGTSATMVVSVVPGGDVAMSVSTPSDDGPKLARSVTCQLSAAPTAPTITYTGALTCSGF